MRVEARARVRLWHTASLLHSKEIIPRPLEARKINIFDGVDIYFFYVFDFYVLIVNFDENSCMDFSREIFSVRR